MELRLGGRITIHSGTGICRIRIGEVVSGERGVICRTEIEIADGVTVVINVMMIRGKKTIRTIEEEGEEGDAPVLMLLRCHGGCFLLSLCLQEQPISGSIIGRRFSPPYQVSFRR